MEEIFEELLLHSFTFLSLNDLLRAERVCKTWKRIANDSSLWKSLASSYTFLQRAVKNESNKKGIFTHVGGSMYRDNSSAIKKSVVPILGASKEKNLLVTGTANKINIWNLDKMICVDSFEDIYSPDGSVSKRLVAVKRGKVVFSSVDNSLSVSYNLVSKRRAGVLMGHTNKVSTMNWDNPTLLCTGSRDMTVRYWDTRNYSNPITISLSDRVRAIRPLDSSSPISIICSGNGLISYYDIRNVHLPVEELNVDVPEGLVTGMKITADSVVYSVNHTSLYKYRLDTHTTTAFIQDDVGEMSVMTCSDSTAMFWLQSIVLTFKRYHDGHIRAYNMETASYLYSLKVGRDYNKVICMMFDEGQLVYGLDNGISGVCNFDKPSPRTSSTSTLSYSTNLPTSGTAFTATPVTRITPAQEVS